MKKVGNIIVRHRGKDIFSEARKNNEGRQYFSEARKNNEGRQYLIKYWVKYLIIAKYIVNE